jgi:hypothetical protein
MVLETFEFKDKNKDVVIEKMVTVCMEEISSWTIVSINMFYDMMDECWTLDIKYYE